MYKNFSILIEYWFVILFVKVNNIKFKYCIFEKKYDHEKSFAFYNFTYTD